MKADRLAEQTGAVVYARVNRIPRRQPVEIRRGDLLGPVTGEFRAEVLGDEPEDVRTLRARTGGAQARSSIVEPTNANKRNMAAILFGGRATTERATPPRSPRVPIP